MRKFHSDSKLTAIQRAAAEAASKKKGLYTFEGRAMWPPENMKIQMDRILAPLRELVTDAQTMAAEMKQEADRLDAAAHNDPLAGVSNETLQRMSLLAPFVREELAGMYQPNLADRLRGVAQHGDEALQRLYLRYAQPEPGKVGAQDVARHLATISEGLDRDATTAADKEAADALRAAANMLSFEASRTLAGVDGSAEADMERRKLEAAGGLNVGYQNLASGGIEVEMMEVLAPDVTM